MPPRAPRTAQLDAALDALPAQEQMVIALYNDEERTMKEIGQVLNLTASRVSRRHNMAI